MRFKAKDDVVCRVGMATDPFERIQHWMDKEGHTNFDILADELTYEEAQRLEDAAAKERGCKAEPGGRKVPGPVWCVYIVWTE